MQLPASLVQSLNGIKGFNSKAFEAVHQKKEAITSIRINPAKYSIQQSAYQYNAVPWCQHGYYLSERPSFTFNPLFHAGAFYVQEASSMFLWQVLQQTVANTNDKKILDVCAAPGGKSTLLSTYFSNGLVISNEVIKQRANILTENITKWGSANVIVTNNDPKHFEQLKNYFDVIVIDAPCSGSGLFRKDENAIGEWSENNVQLCSQRQQRIVADVIGCLKEDGVLIYSTCSYSKKEDEDILDWIVEEFQLASCKLQVEEEWNIVETQSDQHQAYGYRFWPDKLKGEGFFIAAFKKTTGSEIVKFKEQQLLLPNKNELLVQQSFISLPENFFIFKQNESLRGIDAAFFKELQVLAKLLYIKKAGVELGAVKGKDFIPSHELAVSQLSLQNLATVEFDEQTALQYLRRKEINIAATKGWNLVTHCGLPLGFIKVLPNRINNYYPNEWRILKG